MKKKDKPLAFVIPWYGDNIRGGAESECNQLAHCLLEAGLNVEILTTCVKEAADDRGKNTLPQGVTIESKIPVRRFPVKKRDVERYNPANLKLFRNEIVCLEEEWAYLEEDINSPQMYSYIHEHREEYEVFIFMPYLYPPTYYGSIECPENAVIIPCLHDEGYAYMKLMRERMSSFKKMIFLSRPECELAYKLYDLSNVKTATLGAYVTSGWEQNVDPNSFREKFQIYDDFILCAGRKEAGKKTDQLKDYFIKYKKKHSGCTLKLVYIGGGKIDIPLDYKEEIIDLGFVDLDDKHNAFAAAFFLCNPSHFESFSIVLMESWLAKRPVLVSEHCKVTSNFCEESNGGLYFDSYPVFEGCIDYFCSHRQQADTMGELGYQYVHANFTKEVIQKKYQDFLLS